MPSETKAAPGKNEAVTMPAGEAWIDTIKRKGREQLIVWVIVLFGGILATIFTPVWDEVQTLREGPERIYDLELKIDQRAAQVDGRFDVQDGKLDKVLAALTQQALTRNFTVLDPTGTFAQHERCNSPGACLIFIKGRRAEDFIQCEVIGGSGRYGVIIPRSLDPIYPPVIRRPPVRNWSLSFHTFSVTLDLPRGLSPGAEVFVEAEYENCPGMVPGQRAWGRSNRVPIAIEETNP